MYITLSLFNAGLARLPSPEIFISAYAVAQSFSFLIESFVLPIRQLMTALVIDTETYIKTKRFIKYISLFVVLMFALIIYSGAARWIFKHIMGVEGRILDEAVNILKILVVFPAIIALRNFFQGLLMKTRNTSLVTLGAIARMLFVGTIIIFIKSFIQIPGGIVAGFLLLGAILIEALAMFAGIKITSGRIDACLSRIQENSGAAEKKALSYTALLTFTIPLILTSFIGTMGTSVINMGLIRSSNPAIAISSFAVGNDLAMIFISPLNMLHQIPLNYLRGTGSGASKSIKSFMAYLGTALSAVMAVVAFTPAGRFLLGSYMGVSEEISAWSIDVLRIMCIFPLIVVVREFYWGILLRNQTTKYIVRGKAINLITLGITVAALTWLRPANPAVSGAVGLLLSQAAELLYLHYLMKSNKKIKI